MGTHLRPTYYIKGYGGIVYERPEWLRMLHRGSGLTYAEVGERIGVTGGRVGQFMQGLSNVPDVPTLRAYASVYGEGIWAAHGFEPIGWRRGRSRRPIRYAGVPCVECGKPLPFNYRGICHRGECRRERQNRHTRVVRKRTRMQKWAKLQAVTA